MSWYLQLSDGSEACVEKEKAGAADRLAVDESR